MMLIYLFLSLIISGVCNQDGVWTKCKPKPGCNIGKCDPIPLGRIVAGEFSLEDNEFPILCQHRQTLSSDTMADLYSRMANLEKRIQVTEQKNTALERENSKLKKEMKSMQEDTDRENAALERENSKLKKEMKSIQEDTDRDIGSLRNEMNRRLLDVEKQRLDETNSSKLPDGEKPPSTREPATKTHEMQSRPTTTTDGGGWTVFQRRMDGSVNFNRNWEDYVNGFGSPDKEYWMGLDKLHRLTSDGKYELRVDLEDWEGNRATAKYSIFAVAGASHKYRLRVGGYSGSAGNSLNNPAHAHDGQFFSTPDRDNDQSASDCAPNLKSGWWFYACLYANLNGVYRDQRSDSGSYQQGIIWYHWKGWSYSLKFAEMKLRRQN